MAASGDERAYRGAGRRTQRASRRSRRRRFASQIFWLALIFVALYLLMARVALPRIGGILAEREGNIDGDLAEAQRLKDESDAASRPTRSRSPRRAAGRRALANEAREREAAAAEAKRKELDATLNAASLKPKKPSPRANPPP